MTTDYVQTTLDTIDRYGLPHSLLSQREELARIFAKQIADGDARIVDPYFTNDRGHNVGLDVAIAASLALEQLSGLNSDDSLPLALTRLLVRVENAKVKFKNTNSDPDGYGSGTFGEIQRALETLARKAGVQVDAPDFWRIKSELMEKEEINRR